MSRQGSHYARSKRSRGRGECLSKGLKFIWEKRYWSQLTILAKFFLMRRFSVVVGSDEGRQHSIEAVTTPPPVLGFRTWVLLFSSDMISRDIGVSQEIIPSLNTSGTLPNTHTL